MRKQELEELLCILNNGLIDFNEDLFWHRKQIEEELLKGEYCPDYTEENSVKKLSSQSSFLLSRVAERIKEHEEKIERLTEALKAWESE
jgi:hypothetical protein